MTESTTVRPMTQAQALAKACQIWGARANIDFQKNALNAAQRAELPAPEKTPRRDRWKHWSRQCRVGHIARGPLSFYVIEGEGDTWEEAFTKAGK